MGPLPKPRVARPVRAVLALAGIATFCLVGSGAAVAAPDLSLSGSDSPDPASVGRRLTYTLTVLNVGTDPAPGSTLIVSIPPGADVFAAAPSLGDCSLGRPTTCAFGTLEPGRAVSVVVSVRPIAAGTLALSARTAPADGNSANDSLTVLTRVQIVPGACANARIGTALDDTLSGTMGGDTIFALTGKDTLVGGDGDDCLDGGEGEDLLDGGAGSDRLTGGGERDALAGRSGADRLRGGEGDDFLFGGSGADVLSGGDRRDELIGDSGNDRLSGGDANDSIFGDSGRDRLDGGTGRDSLAGGSGPDRLSGGRDEDTLGGGRGRDRVSGGPGADTIYAAERAAGGAGNDQIYARPGAVVDCGPGEDTLFLAGHPRLSGNGNCETFVLDADDDFPVDDSPAVSLECAFEPAAGCSDAGQGQASPAPRALRRRALRRHRGKCRRRRCRPLVVVQRVELTLTRAH